MEHGRWRCRQAERRRLQSYVAENSLASGMRHEAGRQRCSETWPSCKSTWRLLWLQPDGRGRRQCVVKSRRRMGEKATRQGSGSWRSLWCNQATTIPISWHIILWLLFRLPSGASNTKASQRTSVNECISVHVCGSECVCVSPARALHFCLACLTFNNKTWHLFNAYL